MKSREEFFPRLTISIFRSLSWHALKAPLRKKVAPCSQEQRSFLRKRCRRPLEKSCDWLMLAEDDSRFRTSVGHEPETGILYLSKKNPPPIRGAEGGGERGEDMKLFD